MIAKYFMLIGCVMLGLAQVCHAALQLPDEIREKIEIELERDHFRIPLDPIAARATRERMRTWVARSMDLDAASTSRQSQSRLATYRQERDMDVLRTFSERIPPLPAHLRSWESPEPPGQPTTAVPQSRRAETRTSRVQQMYREGPQFFFFEKYRREDPGEPLTDDVAIRGTMRFLLENQFVVETRDDVIREPYVREARTKEELEGGSPHDRLVRQEVVLERSYLGLPVVNSAVVLGYEPGENDIVLLKHKAWTRTRPDEAEPLVPRVPGSSKRASVGTILRFLEERAFGDGRGGRATVTHFTPAWIQTENDLSPVLAFGIRVRHAADHVDEYVDVVSLTGEEVLGGAVGGN